MKHRPNNRPKKNHYANWCLTPKEGYRRSQWSDQTLGRRKDSEIYKEKEEGLF